ncbi:hypothetical protein [Pedobacter aquatilis]|nr:hypothetical protein [Pedobacter aquatilis]
MIKLSKLNLIVAGIPILLWDKAKSRAELPEGIQTLLFEISINQLRRLTN